MPNPTEEVEATYRSWLDGWRQLAAATGVILSLAFVGYEIRQNTQALRASVRNDLATASREYLLAQSTSPELSEAFELWVEDGETTAVQDRMVLAASTALLRNVENVYFQVRLGTVEEGSITSFGMQAPIFSSRRFRELWAQGHRREFDAGFVDAFEAANGFD